MLVQPPTSPIDRRAFFARSAALAVGAAAVTPFHALVARADQGGRDRQRGPERGCSPDYGPLAAVKDETTGLPAAEVLNSPDNITVSPRGGLVLCEDGGGAEFLHGLTVDGQIFRFAQNTVVLNGERNGITGDFRGSEFAGATYSPDGQWLFFNVQTPGITFAVTGPWRNGAL
jgi:uncharacterized protein DUF839